MQEQHLPIAKVLAKRKAHIGPNTLLKHCSFHCETQLLCLAEAPAIC